jgi:uncharacterized protein (TIGR00251 family)
MPDAIRLRLKVVPRASSDDIVGWLGEDILKVRVAAAPERGRANAAVIQLLAATLGISQTQVRLVTGQSKEHKLVTVRGLSETELRSRLEFAVRKPSTKP